jgi:hypothetical protein
MTLLFISHLENKFDTPYTWADGVEIIDLSP